MRILALDIGDRRIGLAVSDQTGVIAQPAGRIDRVNRDADLRAVADACAQWNAELLVAGLPLMPDGAEDAQAQKARAFANRAAKLTGLPLRLIDERFTTRMANRALIAGGVDRARRKQTVDAVAAALILQAYLDGAPSQSESSY